MPLPTPIPGRVLRYSYLWLSEHRRGREEGVKDRPCAVVLVSSHESDTVLVTVVPITHTPPSNPEFAVEIPHVTKRRLGLDDQGSWIVVSEANRFLWPGPDLRLGQSGDANSVAYGMLPRKLFNLVRDKFANTMEGGASPIVPRTH